MTKRTGYTRGFDRKTGKDLLDRAATIAKKAGHLKLGMDLDIASMDCLDSRDISKSSIIAALDSATLKLTGGDKDKMSDLAYIASAML